MKHIIFQNKYFEIKHWKQESEEYILELQKFLDVASNIEDRQLKQRVITQMLKCDEILTQLAENLLKSSSK